MGCNEISNAVVGLTGQVTARGCDHPGEGNDIDTIVPGFAVNFAEFDPPCLPGDEGC